MGCVAVNVKLVVTRIGQHEPGIEQHVTGQLNDIDVMVLALRHA
jgi:hypothetical protein